MLDNYINHSPLVRIGSDKANLLISPERDIADRVYNIHMVCGNNSSPNLLRSFKSKEYLFDKDITSITSTCGHSTSDTTNSATVSLASGGDTLDITSLPDIISYTTSVFTG